jgi:hypothetical protein
LDFFAPFLPLEDDLLFVFEALFVPDDFADFPALPVPFVPASPPARLDDLVFADFPALPVPFVPASPPARLANLVFDFADLPALPVPFVPASFPARFDAPFPPATVFAAALSAPTAAPFAALVRTSVAMSLAFFKTLDVVLFDVLFDFVEDFGLLVLAFFAGITSLLVFVKIPPSNNFIIKFKLYLSHL